MQAIDIAKSQDEKYKEFRKHQRFSFTSKTYSHYRASASTTTAPLTQPSLPKPINNIPMKKLSPSQLQEEKTEGLCYTYDKMLSLDINVIISSFFLFTKRATATI